MRLAWFLAALLTIGGCEGQLAKPDGSAVGAVAGAADTEVSLATSACEQLAARFENQSAHRDEALRRAIRYADHAAEADPAWLELAADIESLVAAWSDFDAGLADDANTVVMGAALERVEMLNSALSRHCEPTGIAVPVSATDG